MKKINIKISDLTLKISVSEKDIYSKTSTRWFNITFVTLKDLSIYLNNFIENEYLTKL